MKNSTCCFVGHRKINETEELKLRLCEKIEDLILKSRVDTFLFGSKSQFNYLCLDIVSEYKEKYPHIKRVFVRAEYPDITEHYKNFLLQFYEKTYFPERMLEAGRAVYVERNYEMINNSRFCVFYYNEANMSTTRKSGTKIALEYAIKQKKEITIFPLG